MRPFRVETTCATAYSELLMCHSDTPEGNKRRFFINKSNGNPRQKATINETEEHILNGTERYKAKGNK